jgi:hypothetical protein
MKPLYIFDLDGTLALIDHRRHLVADKKKQRWDEFYRACVDDKPNLPVFKILNSLKSVSYANGADIPISGADILIFSGRSQLVHCETIDWLKNFIDSPYVPILTTIRMRPLFNYMPDDMLKKYWYDELLQQDKDRLVCIFDDRQKVVDMWRSIGVTCLQVAPGNF